MRVMGIESSCDETGVAIYSENDGLMANVLSSQVDIHAAFGGVVPEIASRNHVMSLVPLVEEALKQAQIKQSQLDVIAYTAGPGLIGALLTGACFAKAFAFALQIPSLAVHHLEGHILAAQLDAPTLAFPFVVLLVSGGHTQLLLANSLGNYQCLGETLDDAAGEAFDKTAKLMGIPYPGGPQLARLADQCLVDTLVRFPRPMTDRPGLDFSFSGLKTHASIAWKKSAQDDKARSCIAQAFQEAVVDTLVIKCQRALQKTQCTRLVVAGGVGANLALRHALQTTLKNHQVYFPRFEYCTDNGAMIAYAGFLHAMRGEKDSHHAIEVRARWPWN